jgi:hypothetical protein
MRLNPQNLQSALQHLQNCAMKKKNAGTFIDSFGGKGGNWVVDVQSGTIRVKSRRPTGKGYRDLPLSWFRKELDELVKHGVSHDVRHQVIWDMLERCFKDITRGPNGLQWTGFP